MEHLYLYVINSLKQVDKFYFENTRQVRKTMILSGGRSVFFIILSFWICFASYSHAEGVPEAETQSEKTIDYHLAEHQQKHFVNSIGMEFKLLGPGSFIMGSIEGDQDEMPLHLVTISKQFYIGIYEVTQKQWNQIMGYNPSKFHHDDLPVESVSWNKVEKFIEKLSAKEGIQYRLPTEAEWEYACRAGTKTRFYWGNEFDGKYAWCAENSQGATQPVGQKKSNAWGLFDMSGNVYEWCFDSYGEYHDSHTVDPVKDEGVRHVGRGGSWKSPAVACRSSNRGSYHQFRGSEVLGFRLVRPE